MLQHDKPRILIVEDSIESLAIWFEVMVTDYLLVTAVSGEEVLRMASTSPLPDLILLKVMMPDMDGFEVYRRLKNRQDTADIPVIFITARPNEENEIQAFNVGGVDYLSTSISPVVVMGRVKTHLILHKARRDLADERDRLQSERKVIEDILLSMWEQPLLREDFVRILSVPVERTSGDIFLLARRPDGFIHAMVGDSTGHGLSSAIIGPMVMDIFHAMTGKGFSPEEILREINRKLYRAPRNIFMASCFVELSPGLDVIRLWNGGMPEVLFLRKEKWFLEWPSDHFPLGIKPTLLLFETISPHRINS
ncbi:hypothetical protein CCP3SC15_970006 [Gammaproteobacteria bacterium]